MKIYSDYKIFGKKKKWIILSIIESGCYSTIAWVSFTEEPFYAKIDSLSGTDRLFFLMWLKKQKNV